jgi:8-oxo-dGTP diphosphatase
MPPLLVTAAIILDRGKVLITRRPDESRHAGFWEFPGGKIDSGESPEQALTREIREELGVEIDVETIFEVVHYRYDWGPVLILAYQCRITAGIIQDLEVAEHRWIEPAALPEYQILPADQPIIDRLNSAPLPEVSPQSHPSQ